MYQFRAIVLRVETEAGFSVTDPDSWGSLDLFGDEAPKLQVLKVRIPEIHAAMPIPEAYGDAAGDDGKTEGAQQGQINNYYPTVVAASEDLPIVKAGDVINVAFGSLNNLTDGVYLSKVKAGEAGTGSDRGSDSTTSGKKAFKTNAKATSSGVITPGTGDAVKNAIAEWEFWRGRREIVYLTNAALKDRLVAYWKATRGSTASILKKEMKPIKETNDAGVVRDATASPWSATFITYVMRDDPSWISLCGTKWGCAGHHNYVNGGMINRFTKKEGWMTFTVSEWTAAGLELAPGMLLCSGHCDLIVDSSTMIGGNTGNRFGKGFGRGEDTVGRRPATPGGKRKWIMVKVKSGDKIPPLPSDINFQKISGWWPGKCKPKKCKTVQGYLNHIK
jgi:hypothetical protein